MVKGNYMNNSLGILLMIYHYCSFFLFPTSYTNKHGFTTNQSLHNHFQTDHKHFIQLLLTLCCFRCLVFRNLFYELYEMLWNAMFGGLCEPQGKDAKSINVIAENDIISLDGIKENLAYTLVTQREPDNQVQYLTRKE